MGRPMTKPQVRDAICLKRQFDSDIIVLCVSWYITGPVVVAANEGAIYRYARLGGILNFY
jgi:hypothetical protein